ncbi:hypothetical protein RA27_01340 [Ruegeria sp. ANG-R]|uniref:hypothetical protein n=1 Tax=Ruegeria sp. ANG-R TaxID=1577903 RepID=UPI00057E74B4|nr:hypothetical protein [Ruegeria sp. ANG-R]KIC42078.1 hypothetical protein RA27_01340 [Ruegeria sp. ANG-R]
MFDKLKKYLGAVVILIPLAGFFGYRGFEQNIESVAVVCPSLVEGGDCGCVTERFRANYGIVRGVLENMPIVRHGSSPDDERLMSVLEESVRQCGARMVSFDGGTS